MSDSAFYPKSIHRPHKQVYKKEMETMYDFFTKLLEMRVYATFEDDLALILAIGAP